MPLDLEADPRYVKLSSRINNEFNDFQQRMLLAYLTGRYYNDKHFWDIIERQLEHSTYYSLPKSHPG